MTELESRFINVIQDKNGKVRASSYSFEQSAKDDAIIEMENGHRMLLIAAPAQQSINKISYWRERSDDKKFAEFFFEEPGKEWFDFDGWEFPPSAAEELAEWIHECISKHVKEIE